MSVQDFIKLEKISFTVFDVVKIVGAAVAISLFYSGINNQLQSITFEISQINKSISEYRAEMKIFDANITIVEKDVLENKRRISILEEVCVRK